MSTPRLSVLIVSHGAPATLRPCLEAVKRFLPEAQLLLLDNGSTPPLPEATHRSDTNLGFAGGNNLLAQHATGDYWLLLNNDALLPSAQPVEALLAFLETHPQAAAAQATLVLPDNTFDACGENFTLWGRLHHRLYRTPYAPARIPHPVRVDAGKGACLLLRRSAIDRLPYLFDPRFFCYYEDIDLCYRLHRLGYETWFIPTEPVRHDERTTSRTLPQAFVWHTYLTNIFRSARTNWPWHRWLTHGPGLLAFLALGFLWARLRHGKP